MVIGFGVMSACARDETGKTSVLEELESDNTDEAIDSEAAGCPEGSVAFEDDCLVECPEGFIVSLNNECIPPCLESETLVDGICIRPCPEGTYQTETLHLCEPINAADYSQCQPDIYDEPGAAGTKIYVNPKFEGTENANGTRTAPFSSLNDAIDFVKGIDDEEVSILLADGVYTVDNLMFNMNGSVKKLSIVGHCTKDTRFVGTGENPQIAILGESNDLQFKGISFKGGKSALEIYDAGMVEIYQCSFEDWAGNDAVYIFDSDRLKLDAVTFTNFGTGESHSLSGYDVGEVEMSSCRFDMQQDAGMAVSLSYAQRVLLKDSVFNGTGEYGVWIYLDSSAESVVVERTKFKGDWTGSALDVAGDKNGNISLKVTDTFIENHTSATESRASGLELSYLSQIDIDGLTVQTGNVDGITAGTIGTMNISNSTFRNVDWTGVTVNGTKYSPFDCRVSVKNTRFSGILDYSVFHSDENCKLNLTGNVFESNHHGIWSQGKELVTEYNMMGVIGSAAIFGKGFLFARIRNNIIASVGDAGMDLSQIQGGAEGVSQIENNDVFDCRGAGIVLEDPGAARILLNGNRIMGTRAKMYRSSASAANVLGDGLLISAPDPGQTAHVDMVGNSIGVNARLGIMVSGPGASVNISQTVFDSGNGYGQWLSTQSGKTNFLVQGGATVTGSDAAQVEQVENVYAGE